MDECRFVEYSKIIEYSLNLVYCYEFISIKNGIHPYFIYVTSSYCSNCVVDATQNNIMTIMLMKRPILRYNNFIQYDTVESINITNPGSLIKLGESLVKVLSKDYNG